MLEGGIYFTPTGITFTPKISIQFTLKQIFVLFVTPFVVKIWYHFPHPHEDVFISKHKK